MDSVICKGNSNNDLYCQFNNHVYTFLIKHVTASLHPQHHSHPYPQPHPVLVHSKPKTTSVMRSPPLSFVSSHPFVFPDRFSRAEGPLPVCGVAEPAPGTCTTRINRVKGERSCDARNVRWHQCTVLSVRVILIYITIVKTMSTPS